MGMFIDPIGIMMITLPVFMPIVEQFGFHPIWFGILFTINMELAYITPPFGFNLFYLKGVVPDSITMGNIYRSVIPFVVLEAIGLAIVIIFPRLSLWLPELLLG
jgi:TRAP-type mannitol/chloroaromatic compound transport system permease large subunit